jgi:hypothetical protein
VRSDRPGYPRTNWADACAARQRRRACPAQVGMCGADGEEADNFRVAGQRAASGSQVAAGSGTAIDFRVSP